MKGYKLIARAIHQNAAARNASKDHPSGKEHRGDTAVVRASDLNVNNVTPRFTPGRSQKVPVTSPISDKKLERARKYAGFGRNG